MRVLFFFPRAEWSYRQMSSPLGILSIASYLNAIGHQAAVCADVAPLSRVKKEILRFQPDMVGVSVIAVAYIRSAISGTYEVALRCGGVKETVLLDGHGAGLLIEPQAWRSMRAFSDDCVLLVLCDRYYEAEDIVPAPEQTGPAGPADAG